MIDLPELVAPAGNIDRLKVALLYGADAVYLSGQRFGLRAAADNHSLSQISTGVAFAKNLGRHVYVVVNAFLRDSDLAELFDFVQALSEIKVDAIVASDLGVIKTVQKASNLPVFLSTQASCLNSQTAQLWKSHGIKRVILGREVSIDEAKKIKLSADIAVEMFIHGAMCMAYSGHCTLSNFLVKRDANRGGCIHLCRHNYQITHYNNLKAQLDMENGLPFLSSKDLCGLEEINRICQANIDALKIEGRMRSALYLATVCRAYRQALDAHRQNCLNPDMLNQLRQELLHSFPNRTYCSGSLKKPASGESLHWNASDRNKHTNFIGTVIDKTDDRLALRLFAPLNIGDQITLLPFTGPVKTIHIKEMFSLQGQSLLQAKQEQVIYLPMTDNLTGIESLNIVRSVLT